MPYDWTVEISGLIAEAVAQSVTPEEPFALNAESKSAEEAKAFRKAFLDKYPIAEAVPLFQAQDAPNRGKFTRITFPGVEAILAEPIAYDVAYGIAAEFSLRSVEPDIPTSFFVEPGADQPGQDAESAIVSAFCEVSKTPPDNKHWAIELIKVPEAIAYAILHKPLTAGGAGVRVAQPDTGVTKNLDLEHGALDPGLGWSILEGKKGAIDPLNYKGNPGHGTATSSVVVSRPQGVVMGSAPLAQLYPIRCIRMVTIFTAGPVAQAIEKAIEVEADVITMSLGGVPSRAVRTAIRTALGRGIIVLAAAGNCVRIVVWPARYPETIAVAGCNIDKLPWKGSCRGDSVDITAPGEQVWHASATAPAGYKDGQGTSFAVALVAGAAAQWLSFHGKSDILAEAAVRKITVQELFRHALQHTAQAAVGLPNKDFGPGIVNVEGLLKTAVKDLPAFTAKVLNLLDDGTEGDSTPKDYIELLRAFDASDAEAAHIDWNLYGAEVGSVALRRAVSARAQNESLAESAPSPASPTIKAEASNSGNSALTKLLEGTR